MSIDLSYEVWSQLSQVPDKERALLLLVLMKMSSRQQLSITDLAKELGTTQPVLYRKLSRALVALGMALEGKPAIRDWLEETGESMEVQEKRILSRLLQLDRVTFTEE